MDTSIQIEPIRKPKSILKSGTNKKIQTHVRWSHQADNDAKGDWPSHKEQNKEGDSFLPLPHSDRLEDSRQQRVVGPCSYSEYWLETIRRLSILQNKVGEISIRAIMERITRRTGRRGYYNDLQIPELWGRRRRREDMADGGLAQGLTWRYPQDVHVAVVIDPVPAGAEEGPHGPVHLAHRVFSRGRHFSRVHDL